MMIKRDLQQKILKSLQTMPVVALLGPRQVGKTTLALEIAKTINKESAYQLGASWEAFVLENILNQLSNKWRYSYYRTSAQAEVDLILEGPKNEVWAIEIKRSCAPKVSKGFHYACADIKATHKFVIYPGKESFPLTNQIQAMNLMAFLKLL